MAGTSVMTIFVALPIGVTLSVQFALLAGQVGATSWPARRAAWR